MAAALLTVGSALPGRTLHGQIVESGLPFLVVPNGARLVGIGGAGVADPSGQDALLTNPAAFARPRPRELVLDFANDAVASRYVIAGSVPVRLVGTFAAGIYVAPQAFDNTDSTGTTIGRTIVRDVAYTASYATRFGRQFLTGLTYKYIQKRYDCSGGCDDPNTSPSARPSTTALDVGVQIDSVTRLPLAFGIALRDFGLPFQYKDNEQRDPLPTRLAVGAALELKAVERYLPKSSLRAFGEVAKGVGGSAEFPASYHLGGELRYQGSVALRVGYAGRHDGYSGPAVGLGFVRSRLALDIARQLGASGLLADQPPTYVALRYAF